MIVFGGIGTVVGAVTGWFAKRRNNGSNGHGSKEIIAAINGLRQTMVDEHERSREHFTNLMATMRAESELAMLRALHSRGVA